MAPVLTASCNATGLARSRAEGAADVQRDKAVRTAKTKGRK